MISSCNINGVPRTIHITVWVSHFNGLKLLIEQKEINNPKGIAPKSTTTNNLRDCKKPTLSAFITMGNCSVNVMICSALIYFYSPKAEEQKAPLLFMFLQ
jgi:hypothetical protein